MYVPWRAALLKSLRYPVRFVKASIQPIHQSPLHLQASSAEVVLHVHADILRVLECAELEEVRRPVNLIVVLSRVG